MAAKTMAKTVSTKRKREEGVSARKIRVLEEESATTQVDDMRSSDEDGEDEEDEEEEEEEELDAAEIFRRHFEARFKPLPDVKEKKGGKKGAVAEEEEDDDEDEEWGGLSGEGSEDDDAEEDSEDEGVKRRKIDVVEHTAAVSAPKMSKAELKAFMSARPPTSATTTTALTTPTATDPSDKDNTANDLALHRLLTESHLLTSTTTSSSSHQTHVLEGTNRHRATDLRIQALGGKGSLFVQAKMPMHMRKGIAAKAEEREKGRREGAREGGIILERLGGKEGKRDRRSGGEKGLGRGDVGAPGVGRFMGGALRISKREVREIEGPKTRGGKGGRGGRGGRGGGRGKGRGRGK